MKTKRLIVVISLATGFWFNSVEATDAIGLLVRPTPIVQVESNYKNSYKFKPASIIRRRLDKIVMTDNN